VLCLAPEEGLGVEPAGQEFRAKHLDAINRFRNVDLQGAGSKEPMLSQRPGTAAQTPNPLLSSFAVEPSAHEFGVHSLAGTSRRSAFEPSRAGNFDRKHFDRLPPARVLRILTRLDALSGAIDAKSQVLLVTSSAGATAQIRPGLLLQKELRQLVEHLRLDWDDFVSMM
jgi:hypothetical protein